MEKVNSSSSIIDNSHVVAQDVKPYTGGFYKWIQRGLGEFLAFQAGWCRTIAILFITIFSLISCRYDFGALVTSNVTFILNKILDTKDQRSKNLKRALDD